jgi:preprotein translocase subunit YajC
LPLPEATEQAGAKFAESSRNTMQETLLHTLAWAAQTTPAGAPQGDMKPLIWMLVGIGALFYFMILRPQKTEQRKRESMLDQVAKGDQVVTAGGIHGTVESVDKEKGIVTLAVAPKIHMRFSRSAITTVTAKKGKSKDEAESAE